VAQKFAFCHHSSMRLKRVVNEFDLAAIAKRSRMMAGLNRAQAARVLGVARQSLIYAEDRPEKSFTKLRCRIIERYSAYKVSGPVFVLKKRKRDPSE
jgi:DNA-binding XRE family transcriptional regulator